MKFFFILAVTIAFLSNLICSGENGSISPIEVRKEILHLHGLKNTQDSGTFGIVLDEMFFWFLNDVNVRKYIADSEQGIIKDRLLNSEVSVLLFRGEDGKLKKVVCSNKYLLPLETRMIIINFEDKNFTSVKVHFMTLSGTVGKEITLHFKKGEIYPLDKEKDFIHWGRADITQLQKEFETIKDMIIEQNFIDLETEELGSLGEVLNALFRFTNWMRSEDIFIIRHKGIKDIPLQELYADCFFIASNLSLIVLYNGRSEIDSVCRTARLGDEIDFKSIVFAINGLIVKSNKYNMRDFKLNQQEEYLIPYTKTEPN